MGRSRKLEYLVKNYSDTDTNNQNFIFLMGNFRTKHYNESQRGTSIGRQSKNAVAKAYITLTIGVK